VEEGRDLKPLKKEQSGKPEKVGENSRSLDKQNSRPGLVWGHHDKGKSSLAKLPKRGEMRREQKNILS